ncbi:serine protease Hayan-like isoform X2 [Armigeres subalbatus]|uniref:serine protease Hayan-like isoform X2 n=1 Tax=Armigeres subalbatus TaxID=124917 RepID=UPI002ED3609B
MQNIIIAFSTYHRKMLSLLLVLVLLDLTQLSEEADIVFRNTGHDEGDACSLDNGLYGQCRRHSQCIAYSELKNQCGFIGSEPVLCCDVLQEQCNAIRLARTGKPPVVDHIIGETEIVEIEEFPFMALLMYSNPEFRCGASLVSDRFLLTAAHCIRNREQMVPESVMLGTIEADDPGATIIRINRTFVHENYKAKTKQNDIAIIRIIYQKRKS